MSYMNNVLTKEWLEEKYLIEWLSSTAIGKLVGCSRFTILRELKKHNILVRKVTKRKPLNITFFDNIDTEEKAYWLGFITADGNVSKNGYATAINLSAIDKSHLEKLAMLINGTVKDTKWSKNCKDHNGCYLHVSDQYMHKSLCKLGVVPNKTEADQSMIFNFVPNNLRNHFIRGLFDGDGSITYNRTKPTLCVFSICGENNLIQFVQTYISNELGFDNTKIDIQNKHSILRWSGRTQCDRIYKWLYNNANVYLERKKDIFEQIFSFINKTKYHGVTRLKNGKWNSFIHLKDGKRLHIGNFNNEEDAAKAYDLKAIELGWPSYKINFKENI